MLNNLRISKSGMFLKINRPISITTIERTFRDVSKNKIGKYEKRIVKQQFQTPNPCLVSFLVFKYEEEPSFLANSSKKEIKFAFLILVEFENYLIINKKNIPGVEKHFEQYCSRLEYERIQYLFSDLEPSYEKMALSYMGISRAAILRKTLESADLTGQLGAQSSKRSIPTSTTVKTKEHRHILKPNSSSISKSDTKSNVIDYLTWIRDMHSELSKPDLKNDFLDSFAQPVSYELVKSGEITPSAILLNLSDIKDLLAAEAKITFRGRDLSGHRLLKLIQNLENIFSVEKKESSHNIYFERNNAQIQVGQLKINPKSVTISSPYLEQFLLITEDGTETNLQKYFSSTQSFILTFTSPEYIYLGRNVFRDRGIIAHCAEIEVALHAKSFSGITSEKGEIQPHFTNFEHTSVFHFFEINLKGPGSVLICDDLGDEWADYLEFTQTPPKFKLIHCKYGDISGGASQFHVVVAQALKNLGRTSSTIKEITPKISTWNGLYTTSQISRIRSGHSVAEVAAKIENTLKDPDCLKEVIIVVPSLSRIKTIEAFARLQSEQRVPHHIPQLIWLLSGFVAACKEIGVKPIIYCSE